MKQRRGTKGVVFMKTRLLLAVLCALLARPAIAQNQFIEVTKVNVPFDFVVNHTTLPAGQYVVSANTDGHRFIIQNQTHSKYAVFVANNNISLNDSEITDNSKMVFSLRDGEHVLHQIYLRGDDHTHDILHARDVTELAPTR